MNRRLGVIQTPSPTETAWAEAIAEQAATLGVGVLDLRDGDIPEDIDREGTLVVLATTPQAAQAALQPTDWLIIRDTPAMARWVVAKATGEPVESRQVTTTAAFRLAVAETAATLASAIAIDAVGLSADMPVLGTVHRKATSWPGLPHASDAGALAVFQNGAPAPWPLTLFRFPKGDDVDGGIPAFDLTGRARLLMFGPHIHLPPGSWAIDVQLEIDPQQREVPLRLEWGGGVDFVEATQAVREAGVYTITLERTWPVAETAQLRLWLTQARFQGHLRVVSCRVRRSGDPLAATVAAAGGNDPVAYQPILSA